MATSVLDAYGQFKGRRRRTDGPTSDVTDPRTQPPGALTPQPNITGPTNATAQPATPPMPAGSAVVPTPPVPPEPPAPEFDDGFKPGFNPQTPLTTEEMIDRHIRDNLGGPQDTTELERLAREEMDRQSGMNIYNQRAMMGASGFGASGAQASFEQTQRQNAARALAEEIIGIRQQERAYSDERGDIGIGQDIDMRDAASREALALARKKLLEALAADLGVDVEDIPPEVQEDVEDQLLDSVGQGGADVNNTELHSTADESTSHYPASSEAYMDSDLVEIQGWTKTIADDGATVYTSPDGSQTIRAIFDG